MRDLRAEMREGFRELRADLRDVRGEIGGVRGEIGGVRGEAMLNRRLLLSLWATTTVGFAGLIIEVGLR